MARKSRYLGYIKGMKKGQAEKPALSIKGRLILRKEKAKEVNRKSANTEGKGES